MGNHEKCTALIYPSVRTMADEHAIQRCTYIMLVYSKRVEKPFNKDNDRPPYLKHDVKTRRAGRFFYTYIHFARAHNFIARSKSTASAKENAHI